jgi:branched-chain amino acid transport system permease protein
MVGMLYSLVALGFVLIFKASGVFNFAQGAMVLFAALAMARFAEWIPQWTGHPEPAVGQPLCLRAGRRTDVCAGLADRAAGAAPPGQPGRCDAADGHAGHHLLLDGLGQTIFGSDVYKHGHRHAQGARDSCSNRPVPRAVC